MRILLVDDSEAVRLTLAAILEDAGHVVREADSLAAARLALPGGDFDLVLLDVHLTDGTGPMLIPELRVALPAAKIAMLTGAAQPIEGADAILIKGDDPMLLLGQIEQTVART